jgi:ABC-type spermidine/putrescine transport system permease subunit II
MHWMSESDPEAVTDKDVRTKVFDWKVPIVVDGRTGAIAGTLFWTPLPSSGPPLPLIIAFIVLVVPLVVAVVVVRRRRAAPASEAW